MTRRLFNTLFLLAVSFLIQQKTSAAVHTIIVSDFSFSPASGVSANVGDTIRWIWSSGVHTTTSSSIPTGATAWDAPITSSATTFSYVPTLPGTYNYVCTPHAGMGMIGSFMVSVPTGINEQALTAELNIYPNPAKNVVFVTGEFNAGILKITDIQGRLIYSKPFNGRSSVPLTEIPAGIYDISVIANGERATTKLIKE
jgi:plastocyanin